MSQSFAILLYMQVVQEALRSWLYNNTGNALGLVAATQLAQIPRPDLRAGGFLLAAIPLLLMSAPVSKPLLEKNGPGFGNTLALAGVAASLVLGGGEAIDMAQRGQLTNPADPGWIKIIANAVPYLAASAMDFKPTSRIIMQAAKKMGISCSAQALQQSFLLLGAGLVSAYGVAAGNSAAQIGATFAAANAFNLWRLSKVSESPGQNL